MSTTTSHHARPPPTSTSSSMATHKTKLPPQHDKNSLTPATNHSNTRNANDKPKITLLPDPTPAHAPALQAWTSLFGAKTSRPHPDQPTFKQTYSHPNGRLLLASTASNPAAGLIAYRKYDGRFSHIRELAYLGGNGGEGDHIRREIVGSGDVVEVVRLFVAPELRNRGIATLLVRALVELAREDGVGYMYLHTHPFLPGAERLWEKEGWGVLVREAEEPWWTIHMGRGV